MGKIFEPVEFVEPHSPEEIKFTKKNYLFLVLMLSLMLLWGAGQIYLLKNNTMPEQKSVVETINMRKGYILTKQVRYETYKKIDPTDTGDIYYQIVRSNKEDLKPGDLVKFNPRFIEKVEIENEQYVILDAELIQFSIKEKDVKASLLKQ